MLADLLDSAVLTGAGLVILLVVIGVIWLLAQWIAKKEEDKELAAQEKGRREEALREQELALYEQTRQTIDNSLRQSRELAMQHYQSKISAGTAKELEHGLKESHLMFSRKGNLLSVRVAGVRTGWVGVEWMLDPNLPQPLWIEGRRDDTRLFKENAYRGMYSDILDPGREYEYSLRAYDKRKEVECLRFAVKLPREEQWNRSLEPPPPPPTPTAETMAKRKRRLKKKIRRLSETDQLFLEERRKGHEVIDRSDLSDIEKKRLKSRFDRQLEIERDREDCGQPPEGTNPDAQR